MNSIFGISVFSRMRSNFPFLPPFPSKVSKYFDSSMIRDFVEIGFERYRKSRAEIIRFGTCFFRKMVVQIRLCVERVEWTTAQVSLIRKVNCPDVDVLLARAQSSSPGRIDWIKTSAEIVDARGNHDNRAAITAIVRPTLHPILHGKIRAGEGPPGTEGQPQRLARKRVIVGKILHDRSQAICGCKPPRCTSKAAAR